MTKIREAESLEKLIRAVSQNILEQVETDDGPELWPRWMDVATVANYLAKSESCVRNWIREGEIPTVTLTSLRPRKKNPVFVDRYALDRLFAAKN